MKSARTPLLLSGAVLLLLVLLLLPSGFREKAPHTLVMYCAAVARPPLEEIARNYKAERGVTVQLQFGGSGTLLSNLQVSGDGDLFLAADASYVDFAREKGLVAEVVPVARLQPVFLVQPGNPKHIHGIADLQRPDVRTALANPDAASIGKVTKRLLEALGQWSATEAAIQNRGVFKPTVSDVANDVKLGAVDVSIVWDATARQYSELEVVPFPEASGDAEVVTVAVLKSAKDPQAAAAFMQYLAAGDKGIRVFAAHGFTPPDGIDSAPAP